MNLVMSKKRIKTNTGEEVVWWNRYCNKRNPERRASTGQYNCRLLAKNPYVNDGLLKRCGAKKTPRANEEFGYGVGKA
jgi:hypothetical protein